MASTVIPLLTNASATGSYVKVDGGAYIWSAVGTFNGATLTLQALGPDGATAMNVDALTAAGSSIIDVGDAAQMRVAVSVATPSGIYSELRKADL